MGSGVGLWPVALAASGGALVWTGIQDPPGGLAGVGKSLLSGKMPAPSVPALPNPYAPGAPGAGAAQGPFAVPGGSSTADSHIGVFALAVAQQYIGDPYRLGGSTHSGIDCSGLTMVAYRTASSGNLVLPHDCTAQTRRGYRVPRSSVQPGDLVAWGNVWRYQHIALAAEDGQHCLAAWTYGVKCGYGPIDQTMYGGLPTIFRLWR